MVDVKFEVKSFEYLKEVEEILFEAVLDEKPSFDRIVVTFDDSDEKYYYTCEERKGKYYIVTA